MFTKLFQILLIILTFSIVSFTDVGAQIPADTIPQTENNPSQTSRITQENIAIFNQFKAFAQTSLGVVPDIPFNVTYKSFRKKVDENGEPLVKFTGMYNIDLTKPKGQRVTVLSEFGKKPPSFIKDELRAWESDDIADMYYCTLDKQVMDAIARIDDPSQINFTPVSSLPGQYSFNFVIPKDVVFSKNNDGETLENNDPVMQRLIDKSMVEVTIDELTSEVKTLRLFIEDPFSVVGIMRVRALDCILTCDTDLNGAIYAKEFLAFARIRLFGIAQRQHYLRQITFPGSSNISE